MKARFLMPLLAAAALSTLVACDGAEGRKEKYLQQAEASFQAGDYEKARINFKNVLQIDPKDLKGREGIARTMEKLQDWRGAVAQYRAIVEEDPANVNAKVKLGQLYLLAKASDLALTLADEVLAAQSTHDGALALKAGAQIQMGKADEALINAEQAFKINNASIDNIVLLASLYGNKGRTDDAINLLEAEQKKHPTSSSILTLLSRFYMSTERLALAENALKKLVEINSEQIAYKNQLARFYLATDRSEEAEAMLVAAAAQEPLDVEAISSLQAFYLQRDDKAKAEAVLTDAIAKHPKITELRLRLAGYHLSQKKNDDARAIYEALLEEDKAAALKAKTRLAYMDTLDKKPDQALAKLAEVLEENPADVEALTLRGGINLSSNKPLDAIGDLRAVLGATPDAPEVIKMLGRAHQMNGEKQQAVDLYKSALNLQPKDVELRMQLADLLLELKELNQAAKQLETANQLLPDNARILEKMILVYIQGQYLDDADKVIAQLRALTPDSPRNAYYAGLVAQARNEHEAALKHFDESFALKPGAIEPMTAKIKSYIALDQIDPAIAWLTESIKTVDDNPVAHNLLGELWLAKKEWTKARAEFSRCMTLKPDWWIPYRNTALAEQGEGGDEKSFAYLQSVVDKVDSMPLRIEAANRAERLGHYDFAIQQYEKVLAQNPDNKLIVNNLTMLIVTHKSDAASLQRASELSAQLEGLDNPFFMDTAGWVHYVKGDYQRALPIIQQAARGAPEDPSIQYHLAMAYWGTSDRENAARYLEKALESGKPFVGRDKAEKLLAEIKQQS
jgi:tetratricopeptide (TPR) repeat protein